MHKIPLTKIDSPELLSGLQFAVPSACLKVRHQSLLFLCVNRAITRCFLYKHENASVQHLHCSMTWLTTRLTLCALAVFISMMNDISKNATVNSCGAIGNLLRCIFHDPDAARDFTMCYGTAVTV